MLLLIKILWLVVIALLIHRLTVGALRLLKSSPSRHAPPSSTKRFDPRGEDIEDGEFKELR